MIKKLQHKFIAIAITVVSFVILSIVLAINVVNYRIMCRTCDTIIAEIVAREGEIQNDNIGVPDFPEQMPFPTRYFIVRSNSNGNITDIDVSRAEITQEQAKEYYEKIGKDKAGFEDEYRYGVHGYEDGRISVFLDSTRDINSVKSFAIYSALFSSLGIVMIIAFIIILSKFVLVPVEEGYEKQKRFITDAGHELKTPLTVISASAELLEMQHGKSEWTQEIIDQVKRLGTLTNNLVLLSKMEETGYQIEKNIFKLSEAVTATVEQFYNIAERNGKRFNVQIAQNIKLFGNEEMIKRAVLLMTDNAIKYSTTEEILITLSVTNKGMVVFRTHNGAEGYKKGNHDELFERFYRPDQSRNSIRGGHGIGMSVIQRIALLHNGNVLAHSIDGETLTVSMTLG